MASFRRTAPKLADQHHGFNGQAAKLINRTVGSMWLFWISLAFFVAWIGGLGAQLGDPSPYGLMLLYVGGCGQWLCMIAILHQGNTMARSSDDQAAHISGGVDEILRRLPEYQPRGKLLR